MNIFGGSDNWMAVNDKPNEWVTYNKADGRLCKTHTQVANVLPGWGESKGANAFYRAAKCCPKPNIIRPMVMYGDWIRSDTPVQAVKQLTTGENVYLIADDGYVKMITQSGVAKYFSGTDVNLFNPNSWNSYTDATGHYLVKPA